MDLYTYTAALIARVLGVVVIVTMAAFLIVQRLRHNNSPPLGAYRTSEAHLREPSKT